jgi:ferritin
LIETSRKENDHATEAFLKFFVDEQLEEEMQFTRLIDRIKLIGGGPQSLYYIDKELEKLANAKPEDSAE